MIRKIAEVLSVLMACLVFAGCGPTIQKDGSDSKNSEVKDSSVDVSKPVTIKLLRAASLSDELFQMLVVEPMAKKYPNIRLNC